MKLKGVSLKPPEIKSFLQANYEEKAPPQINDYMLDEMLSNLYGKAYKLTPRYKAGFKMQETAHKKYKGYQFEVVGHSQGGLLTHLLSDKSKNAYLVNLAYKKEQLRDNEYDIRSSGDIVSKLSVPRK